MSAQDALYGAPPNKRFKANTVKVPRPVAIVLDIEGTLCSKTHYEDVLLPYSRNHLKEYLLRHDEMKYVRKRMETIKDLYFEQHPEAQDAFNQHFTERAYRRYCDTQSHPLDPRPPINVEKDPHSNNATDSAPTDIDPIADGHAQNHDDRSETEMDPKPASKHTVDSPRESLKGKMEEDEDDDIEIVSISQPPDPQSTATPSAPNKAAIIPLVARRVDGEDEDEDIDLDPTARLKTAEVIDLESTERTDPVDPRIPIIPDLEEKVLIPRPIADDSKGPKQGVSECQAITVPAVKAMDVDGGGGCRPAAAPKEVENHKNSKTAGNSGCVSGQKRSREMLENGGTEKGQHEETMNGAESASNGNTSDGLKALNPSKTSSAVNGQSVMSKMAFYQQKEVEFVESICSQWLDEGRQRIPALQYLLGLVVDDGFKRGVLKSGVHRDCFDQIRKWRELELLNIYVYNHGSVAAQRLLFKHTPFGDLSGCVMDYFDRHTMGHKEDEHSFEKLYEEIRSEQWSEEEMDDDEEMEVDILYISADPNELRLADKVGFYTVQCVRNGAEPDPHYEHISDFHGVEWMDEHRMAGYSQQVLPAMIPVVEHKRAAPALEDAKQIGKQIDGNAISED